MGEAENRQVAERLFEAIRGSDVELFHEQFHEDSVLELPQSGERIVGDESRRQVYRSFPGRPTVNRILTGGDLAVVEAHVDLRRRRRLARRLHLRVPRRAAEHFVERGGELAVAIVEQEAPPLEQVSEAEVARLLSVKGA